VKFAAEVYVTRYRHWGAHLAPTAADYRLTATMIVPNAALELSVEQLMSALDRKLFMEYARVQTAMPPMSLALVATLGAEVQSQDLKSNLEC